MDSAGDLPAGWAEEYEIDIIPINIHFGEKTYLQGVNLNNAEFYKLVQQSGVIPKTSQPTPNQFIKFYVGIAEPEEDIISIHVTGKLSGTLNSAVLAAKELAGKYNIIPIDSRAGTASQGYMCREARELDRNSVPLEAIIDRMIFIAQNTQIIFTLDTLEYVRMSGRVKALQAAFGSLLKVKPIIVLRDGILEMGDRVRTRRRSLEFIVEKMRSRLGDRLLNMAVVHSEDPEAGELLYAMVSKNFNCNELIMTELSTGIAANLGPGTIGIVAYPVEES